MSNNTNTWNEVCTTWDTTCFNWAPCIADVAAIVEEGGLEIRSTGGTIHMIYTIKRKNCMIINMKNLKNVNVLYKFI